MIGELPWQVVVGAWAIIGLALCAIWFGCNIIYQLYFKKDEK